MTIVAELHGEEIKSGLFLMSNNNDVVQTFFNTPFLFGLVIVVLTTQDLSNDNANIIVTQDINVQLTDFTVRAIKLGGGPSSWQRLIHWIATNAGNP